MDHRRNEPEFDELEKLLLEIPKVTSGHDYSRFPVCLSSSPFQEQNLHLPGGDYAFTSSLAQGNLNFGISNQTPDNPNLMFIPSYTSPCGYADKFDPQLFSKLQHVGCFPNISPPQPQRYMPSSLSHHQGLDQSHINWRSTVEEERLINPQEEQYMPVNPHYLYRQAQQSNRNSDGHARKRMYYPEKLLVRSPLGANTAKLIKYGVGGEDDSHNRRLCLQLDEDLSMSLNNLTLQPPKFFSLAEAREKIYYMAKDQHGCRFLQRKFAEGDENDIEMIFNEIIDYLSELMVDPFGNYLVQKLLEVCNDDQRMQIVCSITRKPGLLIKIACDMHGTRVIQKIVETVKRQEEISVIVSALRHGIVTLMKNVNGNHVVQRCLQYLLPYCKKILFGAAITHCVELATDRHGCCVLQKCIGHFEGEQKDRLVLEIISNSLLLSQDPFGNYALQYVFQLHLEWAINEILEQLEGNYTELSMQKCSSNVVEKCLTLADDKHQARIIRELVTYGRLDQVMLDPYGNYVIQAALKQSKGTLHGLLVDAIKIYTSSLRTNSYGKKVLSALNSKK
ncbi:Pumilio-like protein 12 [Raphanus sativus]|nr:Pumilio-like protein 12 [Raphanus sativus]